MSKDSLNRSDPGRTSRVTLCNVRWDKGFKHVAVFDLASPIPPFRYTIFSETIGPDWTAVDKQSALNKFADQVVTYASQ